MGPTQPPAQKSGALWPEIKRLGYEAGHSSPSNARKRMKGGILLFLHTTSRRENDQIWPVPEAVVSILSTPDDGCCDTRNMQSDSAVNKYLHTVASGWIFINITSYYSQNTEGSINIISLQIMWLIHSLFCTFKASNGCFLMLGWAHGKKSMKRTWTYTSSFLHEYKKAPFATTEQFTWI